MIAAVLPRPGLFRLALVAAWLGKPERCSGAVRGELALAPRALSRRRRSTGAGLPARGVRRKRVALLTGCVQTVVAPEITRRTIRLLRRHGVSRSCGRAAPLLRRPHPSHGEGMPALAAAARRHRPWSREIDGAGLDAIVINASGCGTTVKTTASCSARIAVGAAGRRACPLTDITEFLSEIGLAPAANATGLAHRLSFRLLDAARRDHGGAEGFADRRRDSTSVTLPEGHLCCGSAGTYNLLQPALAGALRPQAPQHRATRPMPSATGNIGCIAQLAPAASVPVLHTVELLDWATGGPAPGKLNTPGLTNTKSSLSLIHHPRRVFPRKRKSRCNNPVACPGPPLIAGATSKGSQR